MNNTSPVKTFFDLVIPTPLQATGAFVISLFGMLALQRHALLQHFGGGEEIAPAATRQFNLQVAHVLGLSLVGQVAIIIFWSIVGLVAYLLVWLLNNALINARNEVIIGTSYTNQKGPRFHPINLLLKAVALVAMVASTAALPYGLNAWLRLWQELLTASFSWHALGLVFASILGFAVELYLSFMLFQIMIDRFRR
ncbi:MAG: hypothetical protein ABIS59_02610 [Candidatus Saccharibacteria bacterium]